MTYQPKTVRCAIARVETWEKEEIIKETVKETIQKSSTKKDIHRHVRITRVLYWRLVCGHLVDVYQGYMGYGLSKPDKKNRVRCYACEDPVYEETSPSGRKISDEKYVPILLVRVLGNNGLERYVPFGPRSFEVCAHRRNGERTGVTGSGTS